MKLNEAHTLADVKVHTCYPFLNYHTLGESGCAHTSEAETERRERRRRREKEKEKNERGRERDVPTPGLT